MTDSETVHVRIGADAHKQPGVVYATVAKESPCNCLDPRWTGDEPRRYCSRCGQWSARTIDDAKQQVQSAMTTPEKCAREGCGRAESDLIHDWQTANDHRFERPAPLPASSEPPLCVKAGCGLPERAARHHVNAMEFSHVFMRAASSEGAPDWSAYRGIIRVLVEMRNLMKSSHVADRPMLEHWSALLVGELDAELRAKLPALEKQLASLEQAKRVNRATLDKEITL